MVAIKYLFGPCLYCKDAKARVRGLCMKCYDYWVKRIYKGSETWQDLEQRGIALKPIRKH